MYQQGLRLTVLKVLSTTQSVPNAYTVSCPNGAIESVCIGGPESLLLATSAAESVPSIRQTSQTNDGSACDTSAESGVSTAMIKSAALH